MATSNASGILLELERVFKNTQHELQTMKR